MPRIQYLVRCLQIRPSSCILLHKWLDNHWMASIYGSGRQQNCWTWNHFRLWYLSLCIIGPWLAGWKTSFAVQWKSVQKNLFCLWWDWMLAVNSSNDKKLWRLLRLQFSSPWRSYIWYLFQILWSWIARWAMLFSELNLCCSVAASSEIWLLRDKIILTIFLSIVDNVANPCRSYTRLTDATRSIRYFKSNLYSNDRNILGWYRFEEGAGDMLVPHEPRWQSRVYRCQAIAYGWLNGKHPTQAEGKVFRKACFAYNGDSCWHTTDIKVQNCGSFYVYLLDGLAYYRYSDYLRYCGVGEPGELIYSECCFLTDVEVYRHHLSFVLSCNIYLWWLPNTLQKLTSCSTQISLLLMNLPSWCHRIWNCNLTCQFLFFSSFTFPFGSF